MSTLSKPQVVSQEKEARLLLAYYRALRRKAGHRGWWPGRTRLEIILGAILTANTSWSNVERALQGLRSQGLLRLEPLRRVPESRLAQIVRASGYFRQKARKIKAFQALLDSRFDGSLRKMGQIPTEELRKLLLSVWGIGPETADSILLYVFRRPVFVVDAYTSRVLARHGLRPHGSAYAATQSFLMERLPTQEELFNDYHAQFVWVGQRFCRTRPRCEGCPLRAFLPESGPVPDSRKPGIPRGV